jgi:hypothetical protein
MIRVRQVSVRIEEDNLKEMICSKLRISKKEIKNIKIKKRSIDARKKPDLFYVYEVDVEVLNEDLILKKNKTNDILKTPNEEYKFNVTGMTKLKSNPIIIGSGPAGLFCAYMLAKYNYKPIIIERGEKVEDRIKTVEEFWNTGKLNPNSNVQFGEGGAGTFSDGKLNTLVKDPYFRNKKVLEIFVENGANKEILYDNKPHIGTDELIKIVKNIREKIINRGGKFIYNSVFNDIEIENNKIKKIKINNEWINTDVLVLALGHSSRDTFNMLYKKGLNITSKPFAIGIRIQHKQEMISKSQYGQNYKLLNPASYKLTYKASNNRGVYTFCMCPGGYVVNSSSEDKRLVINGMSNSKRESENANSAIIVTVSEDDFGNHPLDGIRYQKELEEKAYEMGNGNILIQTFKDYLNNEPTSKLGNIKPILKGNYILSNLNELFPDVINESLKEAILNFDYKIKGFASDDALLAAIESRTSSPIKIVRDETLQSNIKGIYPIGEGAGYAGGITSAAMDGLKASEVIASVYKNYD